MVMELKLGFRWGCAPDDVSRYVKQTVIECILPKEYAELYQMRPIKRISTRDLAL